MEEGEKEKLQQNGEASSLALGKVDAGEGELMLSPAQTPQVKVGQREEENNSWIPLVVIVSVLVLQNGILFMVIRFSSIYVKVIEDGGQSGRKMVNWMRKKKNNFPILKSRFVFFSKCLFLS